MEGESTALYAYIQGGMTPPDDRVALDVARTGGRARHRHLPLLGSLRWGGPDVGYEYSILRG